MHYDRGSSHHVPPFGAKGTPVTCAIVVTYNPGLYLEAHLGALVPQVSKIILVDNGSLPMGQTAIKNSVISLPNVEVIWNRENRGIASAFNTGIRLAVGQGFRWVLTFDQDSHAPQGFVSALWQAYCACPLYERVAIIGPSYVFENLSKSRTRTSGVLFHEVITIMASGNLVNADIFIDCGMFDETYFIDYVDHEFCLRARRLGFKIIEAPGATLVHQLGAFDVHPLFGRKFSVTHHSADRRYYNTRNRFRTYAKYWRSEPMWVLADARAFCKEVLKLIVFEQQRGQKLKSIAQGVKDGICQR